MISLLSNNTEGSKVKMHQMWLQEMQGGKQTKREMLKVVKEQIKKKIMSSYNQKMLKFKVNRTHHLKVQIFLN
jgi:hypothetical protein